MNTKEAHTNSKSKHTTHIKKQVRNIPNTDKFFVYGTLKLGGKFSHAFDDLREDSKKATINNFLLYNLGWFPGIVEGDGKVVGELHTYREPEKALLHMDRIEGYIPGGENNLYNRVRVKVTTVENHETDAWVYIFNGKMPQKAEKIESGNWKIDK